MGRCEYLVGQTIEISNFEDKHLDIDVFGYVNTCLVDCREGAKRYCAGMITLGC